MSDELYKTCQVSCDMPLFLSDERWPWNIHLGAHVTTPDGQGMPIALLITTEQNTDAVSARQRDGPGIVNIALQLKAEPPELLMKRFWEYCQTLAEENRTLKTQLLETQYRLVPTVIKESR